MYNILFIIAAIAQLLLMGGIVNKSFSGSKILKGSIIFVLYLAGNTLSGMLGYYANGMEVDRFYLLAAQYVFIIAEGILFIRAGKKKVHLEQDKKQEYLWLILFGSLLIALLCSTQFSFMPVWGNVDEAVHIEVSAQFRNILDGGSNPFYRMLADINQGLERYSYLWAYHYNCAIISKALQLDPFFVNHFIKCLSLSLFLTLPVLWGKSSTTKAICITGLYSILIILFANNWYIFFSMGYTAQLFSLGIAHVIICISSRTVGTDSRVTNWILLPILNLFCLVAYPLTGAVLLIYALINYLLQKDIKGFLLQLVYCLFIVPLPPIWNQIMYFLFGKGNADEALTAGSVLTERPSVLWIMLGIAVVGLFLWYFKLEKMRWMLYVVCWFLVFGVIYVGESNTGYVMYKIMVTLFPMLIYWLCYISVWAVGCLKCSIMLKGAVSVILVGGIMGVLCTQNMVSISQESICSIVSAKPQISKEEYACLKHISSYDENSYDGIEYIGMNGPSARVGFVFLREIPFSWVTEGGAGWSFKPNFLIKDILEGFCARKLQNQNPQCIYVLINEEKLEDPKGWESWKNILIENTEVFRSGNCSVRRFVFNSNVEVERLTYEMFAENPDFVKSSVQNYGECALVNELDIQKSYGFSFAEERTLSMINVKGRSIHDSEFILRLFQDGQIVYENNLSGFEKQSILQLPEGIVCDTCEITVKGKNFSDSIIIKDVDFYEIR